MSIDNTARIDSVAAGLLPLLFSDEHQDKWRSVTKNTPQAANPAVAQPRCRRIRTFVGGLRTAARSMAVIVVIAGAALYGYHNPATGSFLITPGNTYLADRGVRPPPHIVLSANRPATGA